MDVREKLVELLGGCPCESDCEGMVGSCPNRKHGYCNDIFKLSYCSVSKLAQHLIAHGVTVQEWISVDDRLPDKPMKCLVYTKRGECGGYEITYYNQGFNLQYSNVTHWMPLPEPPKGE